MNDNTSGGSQHVIDMPGLGGTTQSIQQGSTLPQAESSVQEKGEQVIDTQPKTEELDEPKKEEPATIFKKQSEDHRRMVIDMLEDKFRQVKDGTLSEMELKQWFVKHPELGETANRSKRVKTSYRELMERPMTETPQEEVEDTPLTAKDLAKHLEKFQEESEVRLLSKQLILERSNQLDDFAEKHKLVDDDYDSLKRNSDALFKANPDWDYTQAVRAAYNAIRPSKNSTVSIPKSQIATPDIQNNKIDATNPGGVSLMSASEFTGGQIK